MERMLSCRKCKKEVSTRAETCPFCGAKAPTITAGRVVYVLFALSFFGLLGYALLDGDDKEAKKARDPEQHRAMAHLKCQGEIRKRLKAPGTADFAMLSYDVKELEPNIFVVRSYVDSQNSYGANLRTNYLCKIKFTGSETGDDSDSNQWVLVDLKLQ